MTTTSAKQSVASRLHAGESFIVSFGGQATPWRETLDSLVATDSRLASELVAVDQAVRDRLAPVATDLLTISPAGGRMLDDEGGVVTSGSGAEVSVPGILLAQHAALVAAAHTSVDLIDSSLRPRAVIGHSQGMLGVALLESLRAASAHRGENNAEVVEIHAVARLIGAAAARSVRRANLGPIGEVTPMLSVRGVPRAALDQVLNAAGLSEHISIGVTNGRAAFILSGRPADLEAAVSALEFAAKRSEREHKERLRGGEVLAPICEYLDTTVPFHSPLLEGAVEDTVEWANRCGINPELARYLAQAVLTDVVDWPTTVREAVGTDATGKAEAKLIVDLGPGAVLARMSEAIVQGTGVTVVVAGTSAGIDKLDRSDYAPTPTVDRSAFAPHLSRLPDGRLSLDTAFTRLTGRSR